MNACRVSVILPAYNAGAFLRPAALSVLNQEVEGLEAIVIDDGSTDGSLDSLDGLSVRVVRRENGGEASARNAGVRAAQGRYVTFLDSDDLLAPGGLAPRLDFLDRNPDAWAVGGLPRALIDERGERIAEVFERMAARLSFPFRLTLESYRKGGFFPVVCPLYLYRREVFDRLGFYDEDPRIVTDCDFHFRLLEKTSIPVLREPIYDRRLHGANLSLVGSRAAALEFRPDVLRSIREVNRRHGMEPAEIVPWENDYLGSGR